MERPTLIGAGLLAILLAAILSGCGDTGATAGEATAKGSARDRGGTETLAVQTGAGASLRRRAGNTYELTVDRPSPRTLYFTDSPERRAQTAPVNRLATWVKRKSAKQGYPANVALSWQGPGEPGSLAATLRDIGYESGSGRLRATLDPLETRTGSAAIPGDGKLEIEPFSNRSVSIVFDGYGGNRCYAEIHTGEGNFWNLESSSAENNAWGRSPLSTIGRETIIGAESSSIWYGCEFSVRYGDGDGNGFTIKVDNPLVGPASYSCQGFGIVACEPETNYYEERNEALMQAEIYYTK